MKGSIVSLINLSKRYPDQVILDRINWDFRKGRAYGILGQNGVGKSTLLQIILRLKEATDGQVVLSDEIVQIGVLGEHMLYEKLSISNNLLIYGILWMGCMSELRGRIDDVMRRFHLLGDRNKKIKNLSTGTKKRVVIALSALRCPDLLVFDEPFTSIDEKFKIMIRQYLKNQLNAGSTIIFSTHDRLAFTGFDVEWLEISGKKLRKLTEKQVCVSLDSY